MESIRKQWLTSRDLGLPEQLLLGPEYVIEQLSAASPSDRETRPSKHRVVVGSLLRDRLPTIPAFDDLAVFQAEDVDPSEAAVIGTW